MIKRVADAVVAEITDQTGTMPVRDASFHTQAVKVARAAIEAMREPTEAMVKIGDEHQTDELGNPCPMSAASVWRAMADEALQ